MNSIYPSVTKIILSFQLLHIWFKGIVYFSWWWIIPLIIIHIIAEAIADKMGNILKKWSKNK